MVLWVVGCGQVGGPAGEPQGGDQDSQDSRCLPLGAPPRPALDLCSRVRYLQAVHFSRQLVFKITEESERAPVFTSVPLGLHWGGACTCDDIGRDRTQPLHLPHVSYASAPPADQGSVTATPGTSSALQGLPQSRPAPPS